MLVILAKGQETVGAKNGNETITIPLLAADNEGEFAQLGVGYILRGRRSYKGIDVGELPGVTMGVWGLVSPHHLIQSWRGMKILEHIEAVNHSTLCHCWYAGGRVIERENDIADVVGQLGQSNLDELREQLLSTGPAPFELDQMLQVAREWGIDINGGELEVEVLLGNIQNTESVKCAIQSWRDYLSSIEADEDLLEVAQNVEQPELETPAVFTQGLVRRVLSTISRVMVK